MDLTTTTSSSKKASEVAAALGLKPHPDGGFFFETLRDDSVILPKSQLPSEYKVDRPVSTAIYFLLPSGGVSRIHRIPCAETFHFYTGDPLTVFELSDDGNVKLTVLGLDIDAGQRPQYTVPRNVWFGSFPTKDVESLSVGDGGGSLVLAPPRDSERHYCLVGVTCAPAFQFEDSEFAKASMLVALAPHAESVIRHLTPAG